MKMTKEILTCPVCSSSFFGAVNKADHLAHDVVCPRCHTRFEVDGFLGRLSSIFRADTLRKGAAS